MLTLTETGKLNWDLGEKSRQRVRCVSFRQMSRDNDCLFELQPALERAS